MDFYYEEEEYNDEFAETAIKTHLLRAEKVKLQEKIELRRSQIHNEILEARNKLQEAQNMLSNASTVNKYSISSQPPPPQIKNTPSFPHPKTITNYHAEKELRASQNKLELVTDDYNIQCEKQKNEIQKLLKKAKKKKLQLEEKIENVESTENQNNKDLEINQKLQIKIHKVKNEKKVIENEALQLEKEVMKLIKEAETIVSERYRGKSKHVK